MEPEQVWQLASQLRNEKEELYGKDSWRGLGFEGCSEAATRKAIYLKAQKTSGHSNDSKFAEDLLDLINWAAFTYCLVEENNCDSS